MDNNQPFQPSQNPAQGNQNPPLSGNPTPNAIPMGQPTVNQPGQNFVPPQGQPLRQAQGQFPQGQPIQGSYSRPAPNQYQQTNYRPGQALPGQPLTGGPRQPLPPRPPVGTAATASGPNPKSLIIGCLGFFGFAVLLFVIFVLFFVSQTSATGENSMAKALGTTAAELTNTLITITNLVFGLVVIIAFFIGIFGVFRAAMAPKLDQPAKSAGYKQAAIAGVVFLIMTTIWVFVSIYLSGKKVNIPTTQQAVQGFVTVPEDTTKLVAPIDIKFDATKLPVDTNRFEITFYQWDFGDGGTSTNPTVTHTYTDVGQYNVKLTVSALDKTTGQKGDDSYEKLVTVSSVQVASSFTADPATGPAPLTVNFDGSSSSSPAGQITSYEWDFKGQNNFRDASGKTASYTFQQEGDYQVKLRVTDNNGQSNISTQTVTVTGPDIPVPVIDIPTADGKYYTNKAITFLGEKTTSPNGEITKYEWDFGDGSPKATTRTANHTYTKAGLYEVILKATDEANKVGQASKKITVGTVDLPPQAIITSIPGPATAKDKFISGKVPFQVQFSGEESTAPTTPIVDYKWDLDGDGQVDASGTTIDYVYKTAGSYNATLTVIDAKENQSTSILLVKVAAQDLVARLTADKVEGNEPLTVTFDASSSSYPDGQITSYEWDFGDGSPKRIDASQVSYKYTSIGTYTASVVAKASDGKTSKATIVINIRPVSLQACFTPSAEQGAAPLDVEFDPRCTQGAVAKYLWDFGDGTTSRTRKPVHTFDTAGSYQVTLEVTDNANIVNTFTKSILVTGTIQ